MWNFKLFTLVLIITISCHSQNKKNNLATILESCKKHSSVECKMSFFNSFPTTFQEFLKEYGYDNIKGEAPNYSNSENHLVFFFETASALKKEAFIDKLIHISKDGKWDADSVNSFQEKVRDYFLANSELFLKRLNSKNEKEIKGFWYFFSDEPHFDDGISKKILKTLKNDTKMKSVYIDIVNKVKKENIH